MNPLLALALAPGSFPAIGAVAGAAFVGAAGKGPNSGFFREFLAAPGQIGAVAPSSDRLCETLADMAELDQAQAVVEWGSGTGVVTQRLAQRLYPGTPLLAVESHRRLAETTAERCPQALVYHGSVEETPPLLDHVGLPACDRIVSGLPWAAFSDAKQDAFLDLVDACVIPGGTFVTFAYVHGLLLPSGQTVLAKLLRRFPDLSCSRVVYKNLPPAVVYRGTVGLPLSSTSQGSDLFLRLLGR